MKTTPKDDEKTPNNNNEHKDHTTTKVPGTQEEDRSEKEEGKVFSYLPFEENDVLTVGCTLKNVIVLLRNGSLCSWGDNGNTLGRKINEAKTECYIPFPIKPKVTFVDLACGREHCIARSDNYRVFSWGSNSMGQV